MKEGTEGRSDVMMVGSPFSFLGRGGAVAPASWSQTLPVILGRVFRGIPAVVVWSSTVVASFLWFLLTDQLHPAVIYCLKLFLTA